MELKRRNAIPLIFAGAAIAVGLAPRRASAQESQPKIVIEHELKPAQTAAVQIFKPVDFLKRAVDSNGDKPLNLKEAQEVIDRTNEWSLMRDRLAIEPNSGKSLLLTAGPGTLVKPDFDPQQPIFENPVIQRFYEHNPDFDRSEEAARRMLVLYNGRFVGATNGHETVINLDFTNNIPGYVDRVTIQPFQYLGFGPNPARSLLTPTTALISVENHEGFHRDFGTTISDIDPDIKEAMLKNFGGRNPNAEYVGSQHHFKTELNEKREVNTPGVSGSTSMLNEFSTDMQNAITLVLEGLPRMVAYGRPLDQDNFRLVLGQAKTTYDEFHEFKRGNRYKEFLVRFAKGAQRAEYDYDKLFKDDVPVLELVDFGLKMLPGQRVPAWSDIKQFYPQVLLAA